MSNIDKAIQEAILGLQATKDDGDDDSIVFYNLGFVEALQYVKDEMEWITK